MSQLNSGIARTDMRYIKDGDASPVYSYRTLRAILNTIRHLHWASPNTPQHHPLPHLAQSWAGLNLAPIHTLRIFWSTPQNLSCRTRSRPYHIVQINRVGLLAPHMDLTT